MKNKKNYDMEFNPPDDGVELTSGKYFYRISAGDPETGSGKSLVEEELILLK